MKANFSGSEFNLKIEEDQRQIDRPFMAVRKPVPGGIPNVKNVGGAPTLNSLNYRDTVRREISFAVSANCSPVTKRLIPAVQQSFASGTTLEHRIFDVKFGFHQESGTFSAGLSTEDVVPEIHNESGLDPIQVLDWEIRDEKCEGVARRVLWMKLALPKNSHMAPGAGVKSIHVRTTGGRVLVYPDNFRAVPLKVVILAVDGGGYGAVIPAITGSAPSAPNFAGVFQGGVNLEKPALSAFPSITWANWPGIFSGQPPKDHGIMGNAFFELERPGRLPVASADVDKFVACLNPPTCTLTQLRGDSVDGLAGAVFHGLDSEAKTDAKSLYDRVSCVVTEPIVAWSINVFYSKSKEPCGDRLNLSRTVFPQNLTAPNSSALFAEEVVFSQVLLKQEHSSRAAASLDRFSARTAIKHWEGSAPDIMAIYFPGPDNTAHAAGAPAGSPCCGGTLLPAIKDHFENVTDKEFGSFVEALEGEGFLFATLFALVADHGLIGFQNVPASNLGLATDMELLFEVLGRRVWRGGQVFDIDSVDMIYSAEGGMAHIFVRDKLDVWKGFPNQGDVDKIATEIFRNATGEFQTVPKLQGALGAPPAIFVRTNGFDSAEFQNDYMWLAAVTAGGEPIYLPLENFVEARGVAQRWPEFTQRVNGELNDRVHGRSGDILLVMDVEAGFLTVYQKDGFPGWHGGPTKAEGEVPLIFNFLGTANTAVDNTFVQNGLDIALSLNGGRLRNWLLTPAIVEMVRAVRGA